MPTLVQVYSKGFIYFFQHGVSHIALVVVTLHIYRQLPDCFSRQHNSRKINLLRQCRPKGWDRSTLPNIVAEHTRVIFIKEVLDTHVTLEKKNFVIPRE